ncbi:leucine-rich repeat protein [Rubritalea tangerina]|uniref:leucine-rich repeat protein n=1 Tax=Rubritalea tangerina TaxID=430798 RepID=UPI003622E118
MDISNVEYFDEATFSGTSSLTQVTLNATIDEIPVECFLNSGLTSITLPDSVEEIGDRAFRG